MTTIGLLWIDTLAVHGIEYSCVAASPDGKLIGSVGSNRHDSSWDIFMFRRDAGFEPIAGVSFSSREDAMAAITMLYNYGHRFENPMC